MVKQQKPPPQISHQDGFKPLKEYRQSDRRRGKMSRLQQMAHQAAGDKDGATSSRSKKKSTRKTAAGDNTTSPLGKAHRGAHKIHP